MQLQTHSKFYYGFKITTSNRFIDFNDGSVKLATLKVGTYNSQQLANEIAKQLNAISSLDFTVTFNRTNRKFTIATTSTFSLLFGTGVNINQSPASLLGYSATDKTGASTYTSENTGGYQYATQFFIQSYKDTSINRKAIDGVVNKSASGVVEVVKFGNERFMEGELLFITNIQQETGSIIRTNESGLSDYIQFIEYATEKQTIEFMKDESDPNTFQSLVLESTESDQKGLDYDVIELYDRGLANYYRSGKLTFRLLE